eukprot:TRINITY_DN7221_c0_g2_i1.p2 TRINITY_DN7221_c0_g2~~TRINITY_DN7221_c0_g2_i1.p2  ORF type:complete len:128 (+),score=23.93 TRINITY_DN7221_c0_g2_i1:59-442(+)
MYCEETKHKHSTNPFKVSVRTSTWSTDKFGLFNYDIITEPKRFPVTSETSYLVCDEKNQEVELVPVKEFKESSVQKLVMIQQDEKFLDEFVVCSCAKKGAYENPLEQLWFVVKSLNLDGKRQVWTYH